MSGQNEPVKVVSLNNIKVVKDYIDKVRGELTGRIDSLTEDYLNDKLNEAQQAIMDAYREDSKELRDRIAYVETFGETFPGELQKLKLQLDALEGDTQDKFDAIDAIGTQVDILSGKYDDLYEGITLGTIFNAGQLDEIIKTAMINEVMISSDQILTPEMYASKVVALIANFGKVKAANIEAGTIAGSSIQSTNTIDGVGEPVWAINNEGSGWLACKNIEWDADGTVRFGKDVKLTWDSISDGQSTLDTVLNNYDKTVQDYVQEYVYDHTEGAATQNELKKAYEDAINAVDEAKNSITATYDEQVAALYTALSTTETALRTDFQAKDEELTAALNGARQGLEEAIKAGDEETANKYKELITQLELKQKALENSFAQQTNAIKSLEDKFNQQENALDPINLSEILAAALVTETEVGSDYVKTPNVLAKKITALLGTFGEVNANDINANTIEGFTVQSPTAVRDEEGYLIYDYETVVNPSTGVPEQIPLGIRRKNPTWCLNYDGSGFVGRGNAKSDTWEQDGITWDAEGKVTLGENVTIKWNKVDGGQDAVDTAKNDAVDTANNSLNTALTNLKNTEIKVINDNLNSLENKYNDLNTNLNDNILAIQNKLNAAVSDGVLTSEELNDINIEYTAINADYNKLKSAIDELNALIKNWQDGELTITMPSTGEDDEDTTITVPNVDAPKSLIDYSELTAAYNNAKSVCEYYNGSTVSKDANGYLIISEEYPLDVFNNYYTAQTNALHDYNRENSYYTSFNRFGSKTTYIGANGIYSGTITGDNIVGGTISGLTVQSGTTGNLSDDTTGPYWQINNQGAGYLAKKNIQWEENGDITITGNTTITGENVSINGDVKINGEAVITGINEVVTTAPESDAAKQFGNIVSEYAEIKDLKVYELNTGLDPNFGENINADGRINIKDNTISVYQEGAKNEICLISGATDYDIPKRFYKTMFSIGTGQTQSWFGNNAVQFDTVNLSSIYSINDNSVKLEKYCTYEFANDLIGKEINANVYIQQRGGSNNGYDTINGVDGSISYYGGIIFSDTELTDSWVESNSSNLTIGHTYFYFNGSSSAKQQFDCRMSIVHNLGTPEELYDTSKFIYGNKYYVYEYNILGGVLTPNGSFYGNEYEVGISVSTPSTLTLDLMPSGKRTIIAGNGLYYISGHDKYMKMTDSVFEVKLGDHYIKLDAENGFKYH